jgi:hypothetical protein
MKSTKTTVAGMIAIVIAILVAVSAMIDDNPATVADWGAVGTSISVGVGLLLARDNDKSSEDVGNK